MIGQPQLQPVMYGTQQQVSGQPYVFLPMSIEQRINLRQQMAAQQRIYLEKRLKENFPVTYVLFYAFAMLTIGLASIALQIALIVNKSNGSKIANGIWSGCACIGLGAVALLLLKYRSYSYFMASLVCSGIGSFLVLVGLVMVNLPFMGSINIIMLVLGVIAFLICISYSFILPMTISGSCSKMNQQVTYNQAMPTQQYASQQYASQQYASQRFPPEENPPPKYY